MQPDAPERTFHPRILPPMWAGFVALAMFVAQRRLILADTLQMPTDDAQVIRTVGIAVLFAGTLLSTIAAWGFAAASTPIEPGRVSSSLLTSGPYRFGRNPIYLGMTIGLIGWAGYLQQPVTLLGAAAFVVIIRVRFIPHEERMLLERFGDEYAAYRARVRRWI
jgi:protein-S-isoprenylcysteine O-methyltransferase Ste14